MRPLENKAIKILKNHQRRHTQSNVSSCHLFAHKGVGDDVTRGQRAVASVCTVTRFPLRVGAAHAFPCAVTAIDRDGAMEQARGAGGGESEGARAWQESGSG
jgi:hypothetical protein